MHPNSPGEADLYDFRAGVSRFIDEAIRSGVACPAFGAIMPPAYFERAKRWQRHCFDHGFAGIDWPAEYGGGGRSAACQAVWMEECARSDVAPYMNFQGFVLAGPAILKFGTNKQKAQFLEGTLSAEILWCQLFSEPGAGSDLSSLTTRAERTSDGWSVTGQKVWTSTAQLAQHAILLARTDATQLGSRGISFFLVDMATPGIEVRPIKQMTGDHEFCEVFLTDVSVTDVDLLGPEHGGWGVATSVLADERSAVGSARIALETRVNAVQSDVDLDDPVARDRWLDTKVRANALGHLLGRSAGEATLGPLTKLGRTELETELVGQALESQAPGGMVVGDSTEAFLYAPGMRLAGGTSEIQRNLIGERLLGLPREPR